jgi:hypothetical protein
VRWRREPALDRETVDGIIRKLMDIDAKLERVLRHLEEDDDEDAEEDGS